MIRVTIWVSALNTFDCEPPQKLRMWQWGYKPLEFTVVRETWDGPFDLGFGVLLMFNSNGFFRAIIRETNIDSEVSINCLSDIPLTVITSIVIS